MYIGHFAIANVLIGLNPTVPSLPLLIGVSFPDLLWSSLIFSGQEKVSLNPNSPLQKYIKFTYYPYSHSLILTSIIACVPAVFFSIVYSSFTVGFLFLVASISHWVCDIFVHLKDLPIKGFGKDTKLGLGLWKEGRVAFVLEYLFYMLFTIPFVPSNKVILFLGAGALLHFLNINSFFGFTKKNPIASSKGYAVLALVGFIVGIVLYGILWKL